MPEKAASKSVDTGEADKIFDMPYLMRELDNGLRVIIVKTDYPDIVNLQIPGADRFAQRGRAGQIGLRAFLRAHDVSRYGKLSGGDLSATS